VAAAAYVIPAACMSLAACVSPVVCVLCVCRKCGSCGPDLHKSSPLVMNKKGQYPLQQEVLLDEDAPMWLSTLN
jgi:hypothetical protein